MNDFVLRFFKSFISKKAIVAMGGALACAIVGASLGMSSSEMKGAICDAPALEFKPTPSPTPEEK